MRIASLVVLLGAVVLGTVVAHATSQAVRPDSGRQEEMRTHFGQVMTVQAAVIRGDLDAVAAPARALAAAEAPVSMPSNGARHLMALRGAAQEAAEAKDLVVAAYATALMLNACGDCHRAVGTMPAAPVTPRPAVGGMVGHMLAHQEAADQLAQGLIVPSTSLWQAGAKGFATAPLNPRDLPVDRDRREMLATEEHMHRIAITAYQATDSRARAIFYSQLLAGCADCHRRHPRLWGPKPW